MKNWTLLEKIFLTFVILFLVCITFYFILFTVLTIKYWKVPDSEVSEWVKIITGRKLK